MMFAKFAIGQFIVCGLLGATAMMPATALAAEEISAGAHYDEAKEAEIAKIAKKKEYPGGRDESDLKVQSQLVSPVRKLAPQAEIKAAAEEPSEE